LFLQCSRKENPQPEQSARSSKNSLSVDAETAIKLAHGLLSKSETVNSARNAKLRLNGTVEQPIPKRIKMVETLKDDAGNPLMHVIHFESDQSLHLTTLLDKVLNMILGMRP